MDLTTNFLLAFPQSRVPFDNDYLDRSPSGKIPEPNGD